MAYDHETPLCYEDTPHITFATNVPVFIIGNPRSGTTILRQLVRKYLDINIGTESHFIVRLFQQIQRYGDLSVATNRRRLIADIAQENCFVRWRQSYGFQLDTQRLEDEVQTPTLRGVLDAIFTQFAAFAGRTRWGDKTPHYISNLPVLDALYPEAQYIHIIRDGRDMTLSLQKLSFGPKNVIQAALYWKQGIQLGRTFGAPLPSSRYCEVSYETLMQKPIDTLEQLARFVQVTEGYEGAMARVRQQIAGDIHSENFYKWKSAMTPLQITRFEQVAGDVLAALGYEVMSLNIRPLTQLEKTVSWVDDCLRRYADWGYTRNKMLRIGQRAKIFIPRTKVQYR